MSGNFSSSVVDIRWHMQSQFRWQPSGGKARTHILDAVHFFCLSVCLLRTCLAVVGLLYKSPYRLWNSGKRWKKQLPEKRIESTNSQYIPNIPTWLAFFSGGREEVVAIKKRSRRQARYRLSVYHSPIIHRFWCYSCWFAMCKEHTLMAHVTNVNEFVYGWMCECWVRERARVCVYESVRHLLSDFLSMSPVSSWFIGAHYLQASRTNPTFDRRYWAI